jgi:hypothetical protein
MWSPALTDLRLLLFGQFRRHVTPIWTSNHGMIFGFDGPSAALARPIFIGISSRSGPPASSRPPSLYRENPEQYVLGKGKAPLREASFIREILRGLHPASPTRAPGAISGDRSIGLNLAYRQLSFIVVSRECRRRPEARKDTRGSSPTSASCRHGTSLPYGSSNDGESLKYPLVLGDQVLGLEILTCRC